LPTAVSERGEAPGKAPLLVLAGALAVAAGVIVWQTRRLYFFGDEWAFLLSRSLSWPGVLEPHNEHWSTLPLIAYRTMFHIFGIDHHLAYALMPILLHVLCCVLLYALMRKHEIAQWPAVAAVVALAFLAGDIGENPLWAFQIGFLGSAALGLLALLASGPGRPRLIVTWAVTVLSLMCSGMALPMMVWLGSYLLLRRGLWQALLATVPPGVVYLLWYAGYGRDAKRQAPHAAANDVIDFAATGIAHVWEAVLRLPGTGGVVFLALLAVALLGRLPDRTRVLALSGLVTLATTYLLLGISRAGLGVEASTASRYAYFGLIFSLPAFAAGISRLAAPLGRRRWELPVASVLLASFFAASGTAQTVAFTDGRTMLSPGLEKELLSAEVLVQQNQKMLSQYLSLPYNPDITVKAFSRDNVKDALPNEPVTRLDLMNASVHLQVASKATDLGLPPAVHAAAHDVNGDLSPSGCSTVTAGAHSFVDLPPVAQGSQVTLTSQATDYPVQLVSGDRVSEPSVVQGAPATPIYIGSTAQDGTLRITLVPGQLELCIGGGG
jgi:hypothetical protein